MSFLNFFKAKCMVSDDAAHNLTGHMQGLWIKFPAYEAKCNEVAQLQKENAAQAKRIAELEEKLKYCTNTAC